MSKAKNKKGPRGDKEKGVKARAKIKKAKKHEKKMAKLKSHNYIKKTKTKK